MNAAGLGGLVEASEWRALHSALTELAASEMGVARTWYRRTGRALARKVADARWTHPSRVVQLLLALTLSETAEEASTNCRWGHRFIWADTEMLTACADRLVARDREWVAEFVRLATSTRFRAQARRGTGEVVALTTAAIAAHDLETPSTETFAVGWASLIGDAHTYRSAVNKGPWHPLTLMTARSGTAQPAYEPSGALTLGDCLAATRDLTSVLITALDTPNALHEWATFSEDGWELTLAVRDAVRAGIVERGAVLDHAFRALSRDDRANSQRVIAEILTGLDPTAEEIRDRVPLILHVVPTAHGSVTKALLAMALPTGLDDEDLIALGTVILARPEKAQRSTLLTHLAKLDGSARTVLLTLAADSDDAAFAAKAHALLGPASDADDADDTVDAPAAPAPSTVGLPAWTHTETPYQSGRFEPYAANEAGLDQARSDEQTWSTITTEAAFLDLVVRFAHRDTAGLRAAVAGAPSPNWYSNVRTPYLLHQWATTGDPRRGYQRSSTTYQYDAGSANPAIEQHSFQLLPAAHLLFTDRLVEETLRRVGSLSELLSTPSRANGTLAVSVLADRARRGRPVGCGPYDLVQALLRLDPTTPEDARLFDGLSLPMAAEGAARRGTLRRRRPAAGDRDGVEVIRAWIAAGGRRARTVDFPTLGPRTSALALPLPSWLSELDGIEALCGPVDPAGTQRRPWGSDDPGPWLGVCPWDVEQLAAIIANAPDPDSVFHAQKLPLVVSAAGPIGPAVHHLLAQLLVHPRVDSRLLAAQKAAALAQQGRLHPSQLKERSLALFQHGTLSLARAAHGWTELATSASISVVWPAWTAVLDAACRAGKKPAGLADLLRATRELGLAARVGGPTGRLPASVHSLAGERGSSKAVLEARALVGAPREGGAT